MPDLIIQRPDSDQYVLNYTTKYLARTNTDPRHNYNNQFAADDPRARIAENWRFPAVDSYSDGTGGPAANAFNTVTFIYAAPAPDAVSDVRVLGSFAPLYQPLPLRQVRFGDEPTRYFALMVKVPKGEVHTYKFLVGGVPTLDPVNPQRVTLENGQPWSRFFTQFCTMPISFARWEQVLLQRLASHILPFRTEKGQQFLDDYYFKLDREGREREYPTIHRLDEQVGVVNFIDKLVAREEHHHLADYKLCLSIIDRLLRERSPNREPEEISREYFVELYDQMASGNVPGWDYARYQNPRYFLQLLRRHTFTGGFSHPKYGGNVGAAGWAFLADHFRDASGQTLFAWYKAIEPPLGSNPDYHG